MMEAGVVFAEHDGTKLIGDLYRPDGGGKAPVLVAVHGGGWQVGARAFYQHWGEYLARHGYALFSIDYRLGKAGVYPAAVYDVKAAVQFVRAKAGELGLDPDRIGVIGDSAGAHLAAMVALAGDQFTASYRDDAHAATAANVKTLIGFYGVYDMLAQWQHDLSARPRDPIVEKFLGASATENRRLFFDASPLSYATVDRNQLRVLLVHGTDDDIVELGEPVGRVPDRARSGAILRAPHHHPRRWPFLVGRPVRKRADELRRHGGAAAAAVSGRVALTWQ